MARLIDADLLMEKLNVFNDRVHGNEHFLYGIETAKELLEDMPTAYDVEKVVGQLLDDYVKNGGMFLYEEVFKTVRKGGVE